MRRAEKRARELLARRSLVHKPEWITTPYRLPGSDTVLFFRDDHLSDLIGRDLRGNPIVVRDHCYGCTAGNGSSCGGALRG